MKDFFRNLLSLIIAIACLLFIFIFIWLLVFLISPKTGFQSYRADLIVNEKMIVDRRPLSNKANKKVTLFERSDLLGWIPYFQVMEAMGIPFEWEDENTVLLSVKGKSYVYNASTRELYEQASAAGGEQVKRYLKIGTFRSESNVKEVYGDTQDFLRLMHFFNIDVKILLDIDNRQIVINGTG